MEALTHEYGHAVKFCYRLDGHDEWIDDDLPIAWMPDSIDAVVAMVCSYLMGKHGKHTTAMVDSMEILPSIMQPPPAGELAPPARD